MAISSTLNSKRLSPDELASHLDPYGSWPKGGSLPEGYFTRPLPSEAAEFYRENGYLVIHNAFDPTEVKELIAETAQICRNENGLIDGVTPVPDAMSDVEAMKRVLCIHFPHKLSKIFREVLRHEAITELLTQVVSTNVKCMQSMLFVKASGKPGQAWHQDEDYIPTRDRSLIGAWISFDDATVKNGCLWVLPGSHKRGVLWPQKFHFDNRFDCTHESYNFPWDEGDSVPVEVKAGSVVFFHGYLLHRSLPNRTTSGFRRSLVNHYMSAESLLGWMKPDEKTGMALADYRDIVMVAGEDPFAYKGIEDIAKPFVRSDGLGGCVDWNDNEQKKKASDHARSLAQKSKALAD